MGKQSRRQRKQIREKRDHAEDHGLPVGEMPQPKPEVSSDSRVGSMRTSTLGQAATSTMESRSSEFGQHPGSPAPASAGLAWSTWPLSIQLVVGGILLLVAIGLYRRCSEAQSPDLGTSGPAAPAVGISPNVSDGNAALGTERASGSAVQPIASPAGSLD